MGLINKVDMVCLSPVGYGVYQTHMQCKHTLRCPSPKALSCVIALGSPLSFEVFSCKGEQEMPNQRNKTAIRKKIKKNRNIIWNENNHTVKPGAWIENRVEAF